MRETPSKLERIVKDLNNYAFKETNLRPFSVLLDGDKQEIRMFDQVVWSSLDGTPVPYNGMETRLENRIKTTLDLMVRIV